MTACVIIVSAHADLLALCRAALRVHAPQVQLCVVATSREVDDWLRGSEDAHWLLDPLSHAARDHAAGIESARAAGVAREADLVILLDDDTVILSERWWPMIETAFSVRLTLGVLGAVRSRGLIGQAYVDGLMILHASMLAMRRELFEATSTFFAEDAGQRGYVRYDTAARVSVEADAAGWIIRPVPFHEPGHGPGYPGIAATEYYDRTDPQHTLWAHLGRGTSWAPRGWWREQARTVAAHVFGSARAAKIIRRQDERQRFIERSWELLMGRRP